MLSKVRFSGRQALLVGLMVVMLAGVVGTAAPIGCPSDACQFTGTGVVRVSINSNSNAGLRLDLSGVPQWSVATVSGGDFQIYDETGQVSSLYIKTDTGNVGIGTTSITAKLKVIGNNFDISGTPTGTAGIVVSTDTGNGLSAFSRDSIGVLGSSINADGIIAQSSSGTPLRVQGGCAAPCVPGANLIAAFDLTGSPARFVVKRDGSVGIGIPFPTQKLHVEGNVFINGSLTKTGGGEFVAMSDPNDAMREIVYASPIGAEVGTFIRGTAKLVNGEAVINLPEHFSLVTNDEGLTVQLTPRGEWFQLYLVKTSTKQIIVREASGKSGQFDYLVQGVRKGFENHQVIRDKEP